MDDIRQLCARAEALCRAIAKRDLGDVPLYVVAQSRLPAELGRTSVCNGYTHVSLDLHLRDVIGSDWRGRGPCMVVNDLGHQERSPDDFERAFLGTAVHELAHILLRPRLYKERPNIVRTELQAEIRRLVEHVSSSKRVWDIPVPWQHHDVFFIRAALHLRYRADRAGVLLAPTQLCAGDRFGVSPGLLYDRALGDEPARMLDAAFHEIKRHTPPKEFVHLWIDDIGRWQPEPEEEEDA